jgi:hypothetical protein
MLVKSPLTRILPSGSAPTAYSVENDAEAGPNWRLVSIVPGWALLVPGERRTAALIAVRQPRDPEPRESSLGTAAKASRTRAKKVHIPTELRVFLSEPRARSKLNGPEFRPPQRQVRQTGRALVLTHVSGVPFSAEEGVKL